MMPPVPISPSCPWCFHRFDFTLQVAGEEGGPSAGDLSVCIRCARPAVFTEQNLRRRPTAAELRFLEEDEQLTRVRAAIIEMNEACS